MRRFALILFLFAAVFSLSAGETNYFCIICGKGPLNGRIWISKQGVVCDDCYKLPDHCSICGLPIRNGDGAIKTDDGRLICKFDKANAVMDVTEAREVFKDARRELVGLFGRSFALNYPDVTVRLFDVDYWSEAGRENGLHKFGFSHTRKTSNGDCTHEAVLLSGRLNNEISATAAHEYTHLWINENRPATHVIDSDTTEAICELAAYKLMQDRSQPEQMKRILENPYTHGEITKLVALENEKGIGYIMNWVKNGTAASPETETSILAAPAPAWAVTYTNIPQSLPKALTLDGLLLNGTSRRAIISGMSFAADDTKNVKLQERTIQVLCRRIRDTEVVLELDGKPEPVILKISEEKLRHE